MVPRILLPSQEFCVTIVAVARRPVPVEFVDVTLQGAESTRIGSGQYQQSQTRIIVRLYARVSEACELPAGRTEYRCRFTLPPDSPPSYHGTGASVTYKMSVRVSIPWWPDAKPSFWINVSPLAPPLVKGRPVLYSTEPDGPTGKEPHMEVSLSDDTVLSGGTVHGAVALHNVAFNSYHGLRAVLTGYETVSVGSRTNRHKARRYPFDIPFTNPAEGQSIPFSLRIPAGVPASYRSKLWRTNWTLQMQAQLRWRRDLVAEVPLQMQPRPHIKGVLDRQFHAPPSVGEERMLSVWRRVAEGSGYTFDGQALARTVGQVNVTVAREHHGGDGIFVVAVLDFDSLHLRLQVQQARGLKLLGGGLSLGQGDWDRKYHVTGRERAQLHALLCGLPDVPQTTMAQDGQDPSSLVQLLWRATTVELSDDRFAVLWRDAGQSEASLRRITEHAVAVARQLQRARVKIPAPAAMARATGAWAELAGKLHGPLEHARMAIRGKFQGIPCEVITRWTPGGEPLHTELSLRPSLGISSSFQLELQVEQGEFAGDTAAIAELPGPARELLAGVTEGAHALRLTADAVTLLLDAPLMNPGPVYERLALLARLLAAVQPNAGPYR